MTQSERNEWLVKNMDVITSTIHRKCEREPELDYDDLYSDMMEYLIGRLDGHYGDEHLSYSKSRITQLVGNRLNSVKKHVQPREELYDPSHLELIYIPDFESGLIKWEYESVGMSDRERDIFNKYLTGDFTLEEIAKEYNLTTERIRQIWLRACRKVFWQKYLAKGQVHLYFRVRTRGVLKNNAKRVSFTVDATVEGHDEKSALWKLKRQISTEIIGSAGAEVLLYHYHSDYHITPYLSKDEDLESMHLDFDGQVYSETKKEPEYEYKDGFIASYILKFVCFNSKAKAKFVTTSMKHSVICNDENVARRYFLNFAKERAKAMADCEDESELMMISPTDPNDISLNKVRFKYTRE